MGRMQVGRFNDRAAALDFLVAKYIGNADAVAKLKAHVGEDELVGYAVREKEGHAARVLFAYDKEFRPGQHGMVTEIGNGADLTAAIVDLFARLGESLDPVKEASNA